jgi:hypothetical protein
MFWCLWILMEQRLQNQGEAHRLDPTQANDAIMGSWIQGTAGTAGMGVKVVCWNLPGEKKRLWLLAKPEIAVKRTSGT